MKYFEEHDVADRYKEQYLCCVDKLIKQRQQYCAQKRAEHCKNFSENQEMHREELKQLLGWPLTEERELTTPKVASEQLFESEKYIVYRMQFKTIGEVYMTGLFFRYKKDEKPLVITLHGALGSPERVAGFYGDTTNYNDMISKVLEYECHVFAPQLLAWDNGIYNEYSVKCDRNMMDSRLKRVGSSIAAVEIYGLQRIIDYFEKQSYVSNIGMVGFSYGGFYTIFTSALDVRVKAATSAGWFWNKTDRIDWSWMNIEERFSDAEIVALICPRKLYIGSPTEDPNGDVERAMLEVERIKKLCRDEGNEWVELLIYEGKHEFFRDNGPIKEMIAYLLDRG